MRQVLKSLWFTPGVDGRWGLPVIFRGAPGTAKTATIRRAVKECGLHVETVLASLRQPEDFLGLPIPVRDAAEREQIVSWMRASVPGAEPKGTKELTFTAVTYAPPAWALRLVLARRGVCFLDEINSAPPAVQSALLRVTLEGVVGELQLPPGIRFVAAMNPSEDAAGGWDIAPPLANRFGHREWPGVDVQSWVTYMAGGAVNSDSSIDPEAEERRVLEAWPTQFAHASGLAAGFLQSRHELLHKMPPSGDPACSGAWASPRTWEMAVRALAGARLHGLTDKEQDDATESFIGAGPAAEWSSYRQNADLPDAGELLDGKVKWAHNPARLDRTAAVFASCASLVVQVKDRKKERASSLWKLLGTVMEDAADISIPAATTLAEARLGIGTPEAVPVLAKLYPVADAAKRGK